MVRRRCRKPARPVGMSIRPQRAPIVNAIYTAALDPCAWPTALSAVHRALGGSSVTSLAYVERLGQGGLGFTNAEYTDPGWHWQAIQAMEPRCPRFQHAALNFRPGAILHDAQHGHDGPRGDADPCYQWYDRELDARFYVAGTLFQSAGRHAYIAVQRARHTGAVQDADVRLLRELLPHLRRAVEINHALGQARLSRFEGDALEQLPQATAAIDGSGRLMACNAALIGILRADDGLQLRDQTLHARRPRDDRLLGRLLARAVFGATSAAMPLPRPSGRRAYGLVAAPVPPGEPFFMARTTAALLFVLDPEALPGPLVSSALLADAFDLTPMQARVAGDLGRGRTLDQVAAALGVSRNTVRAHAREVYRQLGLTRQGDLMALLAAWPGLAPGDDPVTS
jgi:DNA-binding CsgD family transcriptional regulator